MKKSFLNELLKAIENNDIDFLYKNKSKYDINSRINENDNDTLLLHSIAFAKDEVVDFLVANGANINLTNNEGENAIHSAVYSGSINRLDKIYNQFKVEANLQTNDGTTPLLLAVSLGKLDIAKKLIKFGVDINKCDNEGNSPLHLSCFFGYIELSKLLIENGANILQKTQKGNFPMALAVNNEHHEIVKYLFKIIYQS